MQLVEKESLKTLKGKYLGWQMASVIKGVWQEVQDRKMKRFNYLINQKGYKTKFIKQQKKFRNSVN